jgi:hypothetical protein
MLSHFCNYLVKKTCYSFAKFNNGGVTMTDKNNQAQAEMTNTVKDPDEWTTGGEEMTGAQASYLKTLSDEAGEEFKENLTKADASKRIEELQQKTGRGLDQDGKQASA